MLMIMAVIWLCFTDTTVVNILAPLPFKRRYTSFKLQIHIIPSGGISLHRLVPCDTTFGRKGTRCLLFFIIYVSTFPNYTSRSLKYTWTIFIIAPTTQSSHGSLCIIHWYRYTFDLVGWGSRSCSWEVQREPVRSFSRKARSNSEIIVPSCDVICFNLRSRRSISSLENHFSD